MSAFAQPIEKPSLTPGFGTILGSFCKLDEPLIAATFEIKFACLPYETLKLGASGAQIFIEMGGAFPAIRYVRDKKRQE
jgi:hypothetical protein